MNTTSKSSRVERILVFVVGSILVTALLLGAAANAAPAQDAPAPTPSPAGTVVSPISTPRVCEPGEIPQPGQGSCLPYREPICSSHPEWCDASGRLNLPNRALLPIVARP